MLALVQIQQRPDRHYVFQNKTEWISYRQAPFQLSTQEDHIPTEHLVNAPDKYDFFYGSYCMSHTVNSYNMSHTVRHNRITCATNLVFRDSAIIASVFCR